MTELIQAAEDGNITEMKRIFYPGWIDHRMVLSRFYKKKYNKSHFGIRKNIAEFVGLIGVDLEVECFHWGNTALHYACQHGHHKCVELLLEFGANINVLGAYNDTPLHRATHYGNYKCVEILLKHGANINAVDEYNTTPLSNCIYTPGQFPGNIKCVEILLKNGADTEIANSSGDTPLHKAIGYEEYENVELLLKYGANINTVDKAGNNSFYHAFFIGNKDIIKLLRKYYK